MLPRKLAEQRSVQTVRDVRLQRAWERGAYGWVLATYALAGASFMAMMASMGR